MTGTWGLNSKQIEFAAEEQARWKGKALPWPNCWGRASGHLSFIVKRGSCLGGYGRSFSVHTVPPTLMHMKRVPEALLRRQCGLSVGPTYTALI